jgi:hypothetical protein
MKKLFLTLVLVRLPALIIAACAVAPVADAARPMVTDDARIIDPGACQLETWRRFNRDSKEFWALPACNPTGNLEITLGSAELPVEDPGLRGTTRTVQIQGKTLFRTLETNSYSYGFAAGGVVRSRGAADQVPNYYAYVPVSRSLLDDRVVLHVNVGAQRAGIDPLDALTWGLGAEIGVTRRAFVIAESFGNNHARPSYQGGLRVWIVPDRVQIDTTIGAQAGDIGATRWISIGLRLISPPFLK